MSAADSDDVGRDDDDDGAREAGERDAQDELDREAILGRRRLLLAGALAGIAVGGACRDGAAVGGDPPTMTASPVPSACLEAYVPPGMTASIPTGPPPMPCLSVLAVPTAPSVTPHPCLRPRYSTPGTSVPPMPCLSIAPTAGPSAAPLPCLGPRRRATAEQPLLRPSPKPAAGGDDDGAPSTDADDEDEDEK